MKESYLFDMAFNNVVFKNRNMAYGAYKLRKNYNRHIAVAAVIATALFAGALAAPVIKSILFGSSYDTKTITVPKVPQTVIYDPILPPPPPEPKAQEPVVTEPKEQKVATKKYVTPKVVHNKEVTPEEIPTQDEFASAVISNETRKGITPETPIVNAEPDKPSGAGAGATITQPYEYVEQMPMFGKGETDLLNYLSKKIRYPAKARNAGVEGMLIVSFVVSAQGEVQNVQVLKGLGFGTEEEAIRVIEGMPKWQPGRQNGKAVPVRYTLPIRLQMQN